MTPLISSPEELFLLILGIFVFGLVLAFCYFLLAFIMATGEWLMGGEFIATLVYCLNNS
jgi:hypothetical protein